MSSSATQTIAIIAISISVFSLLWNILATIYANYSRLRISLVSTMGLKMQGGNFVPDNEFHLLIRNSAPRENGIIDYLYFRDGWSFEQGAGKMIPVPKWAVVSLELHFSDKVPFPAFIVLQDYDERYYLVPFLNKDSGQPSSDPKVFTSKNYSQIEKRLRKYNEAEI